MESERYRRNLRERGWVLIPSLVLGVLLARLLTAIPLWNAPRLYESTVIVAEDPAPWPESGEDLRLNEECFLEAVDSLDLSSRWEISRERAAEQLAKSISIRRVKDRGTTNISCRSTNPVDARDLAQLFGESFCGWERFQKMPSLHWPVTEWLKMEGLTELLDEAEIDSSMGIEAVEQALEEQRKNWSRISWRNPDIVLAMKIEDEGIPLEDGVREYLSVKYKDLAHRSSPEYAEKVVRSDAMITATRREIVAELIEYRKLTRAEKEYKELLIRVEETEERLSLAPPSQITILEPAVVARGPSFPRVRFWMSLSTIPGLMLGGGVWWFYLAKWRDPDRAARRHKEVVKKHESVNY